MKKIFSKTNFPVAPGGNLYHWQEAKTTFSVPKHGKYVIAITATAKNATQNNGSDDDDMRVSLNGYEFGKLEIHAEKISYQGFGTSPSCDGASLKGGTKTTYFFVELNAGEHNLEFYADETPVLRELTVLQMKEGEVFDEIKSLQPSENIDTDEKGIPWLSFVFLGVKPKNFKITTICKAATKDESDGDNVKVVVNGEILHNEQAPASDTYKNFYFSGDLDKGVERSLSITAEAFQLFEDSVELWYDQRPTLKQVKIELYENLEDYFDDLEDERWLYKKTLEVIAFGARATGMKYTGDFLSHALKDESEDLVFEKDDPIIQKIKNDKLAYNRILEIIKGELKEGKLEGKIILDVSPEPGDEVAFETIDLSKSLHGIKSIEYKAKLKEKRVFEVYFTLHDTYDFDYKSYKDVDYGYGYGYITTYINNLANRGENLNTVNNFSIQIKVEEIINLENDE